VKQLTTKKLINKGEKIWPVEKQFEEIGDVR